MRAALESFESSVLKEMPGKKRDLSTLSELNDKLKGQKKINLPPEYEYSKLAEVGMLSILHTVHVRMCTLLYGTYIHVPAYIMQQLYLKLAKFGHELFHILCSYP